MQWWEAGPVLLNSGSTWSFSVQVTSVGFSSPSVSSSAIYNVTDPDNISADLSGTLLSGSASISTTTWTTPLITGLTAKNVYRLTTSITDSGKTLMLGLYVECPY